MEVIRALAADALAEAVLAREAIMSTGIGVRIAIPRARIPETGRRVARARGFEELSRALRDAPMRGGEH